jgi:hypothetical protein
MITEAKPHPRPSFYLHSPAHPAPGENTGQTHCKVSRWQLGCLSVSQRLRTEEQLSRFPLRSSSFSLLLSLRVEKRTCQEALVIGAHVDLREREEQERCDLCVQCLRCTTEWDSVPLSVRTPWEMPLPGLTSLSACPQPPLCGSLFYSPQHGILMGPFCVSCCLSLGVPPGQGATTVIFFICSAQHRASHRGSFLTSM